MIKGSGPQRFIFKVVRNASCQDCKQLQSIVEINTKWAFNISFCTCLTRAWRTKRISYPFHNLSSKASLNKLNFRYFLIPLSKLSDQGFLFIHQLWLMVWRISLVRYMSWKSSENYGFVDSPSITFWMHRSNWTHNNHQQPLWSFSKRIRPPSHMYQSSDKSMYQEHSHLRRSKE